MSHHTMFTAPHAENSHHRHNTLIQWLMTISVHCVTMIVGGDHSFPGLQLKHAVCEFERHISMKHQYRQERGEPARQSTLSAREAGHHEATMCSLLVRRVLLLNLNRHHNEQGTL